MKHIESKSYVMSLQLYNILRKKTHNTGGIGRKGERADACLQKTKLTFIKIEQNKIIRNTSVIERDFGSMVSLIIENDLRHILGMKVLVYIVVP